MIIVDESEPVGELVPTFPYREVTMRRDTSIREAYEILNEIGRGKFGRVYRCKDRSTGLHLAAKVVSIKRREERRDVEREMEIMRRLHHPRIIQLFDATEDFENYEMCLILEMVEGGELFDRVIEDEFILTEKSCSIFVRQICEGVEYIHSKNIVHLDMKPENVMCVSQSGNRIKIIDFGLARFYDSTKKMQVLFGTPEFVAPEVVNFDDICYRTDMWSIGVITYVLLSGLSPFMGETDVETMANVTIAKYDFDHECFDDVSQSAQDFIEKLLRKDRRQRMTATECLKHPWLQPLAHLKASHSAESESESELEAVEELLIDEGLPDLQKDDGDGNSLNSLTPDSLIMSSSPSPSFTLDRPSSSYLSTKRPSLDMSKDNLKEFMTRYSDNPYVFDSPRGIISQKGVNTGGGEGDSSPKSCKRHSRSPSFRQKTPPDEDDARGINLVNQIRRFSKQLHEELEIMKKQCHDCSNANTLRKCSWGDVSVNAH